MFDLTSNEREAGRSLLRGELLLPDLAQARAKLSLLKGEGLVLDGAGLEALDSAGAMLLLDLRARVPSLVFENFQPEQDALLKLIDEKRTPPHKILLGLPMVPYWLDRIGRGAWQAWDAGKSVLGFFGQTVYFVARTIRHPSHFRMASFARHIEETGIDAMPIISLVAFLISVVLAYQGAFQLRPLGAETFTVNLVAVSVLREMGVLLTAIMVAGRSGSAFTAEIGVMKVNEEVDALSVMGVEPFDMLVLPRLFALLITLPLLTLMADLVGLFGGSVTCATVIDISMPQFWDQLRHVAKGTDFLVGMIKAPIFALIIAVVGCKFGMAVTGSAESVGTSTTKAVVQSIFIVLVADALFSVLFSKMGW